MRVVNIGLAPVVNKSEGNVHYLVHPGATALIQPEGPVIGAKNDPGRARKVYGKGP